MLSTARKIALARFASAALLAGRGLFGLPPDVTASRGGIRWQLDLREGIDLSIYLLGAFEPATVAAYAGIVGADAVVLDVGANIGAHTLPLARLVGPQGRVIAVEPTAFAHHKLQKNVALNPVLGERIAVRQAMLVAKPGDALQAKLFSSWPLSPSDDVHGKHRGRRMATDGAQAQTLDDMVDACGLKRVDFIKLDVDGHELSVLRGAGRSLRRFRPKLVMELCPYVHAEEGQSFEDMIEVLLAQDYSFRTLSGNTPLPQSAAGLRAMVPDGAAVNVLLLPQ